MDIYETYKTLLTDALEDIEMLAGNTADGRPWQDVAGTCSYNLQHLASFLDTVREGKRSWHGCPLTGPVVFASANEVLDG
jgi:hypothetical protein